MEPLKRIVIVGGGFGGLYLARALRKSPVQLTLVDRRNFHLFKPLLYQVATGALSPANIAAPLRALLRKQRNTQVLLAEATGVDAVGRRVLTDNGSIDYDVLVLAAGSTFDYFGRDDWQPLAPGLKTVEDATDIRGRILTAFERAERLEQPAEIGAWLTFVIVGGGATGVEMAGSLAEVARYTLRHDFRTIHPEDAQILLVEAQTRVLGAYPEELSHRAAESLARLGVTVRTGSTVTNVQPDSVTLRTADREQIVPTRTVIWTAGVKASPLGQQLAMCSAVPVDRGGRIVVQGDLTVPGFPDIFVIGDMAHVTGPDGQPLPGVAPVAMQQGKYVARTIRNRLAEKTTPAFAYRNRGNLATIGRSMAVADLGWVRFSGFLAWLVWLFVHLMYIVQFQNRVLVLTQWAWNYFTRNRSARLITDGHMPEAQTEPLECPVGSTAPSTGESQG